MNYIVIKQANRLRILAIVLIIISASVLVTLYISISYLGIFDQEIVNANGSGDNKNNLQYQSLTPLVALDEQLPVNGTYRVLRNSVKFLSSDLDEDLFSNRQVFVPVGIVKNKAWQCKFFKNGKEDHEWFLSRIKVQKAEEFFMEVGFIRFFEVVYKYSYYLDNKVHFNSSNKHRFDIGPNSLPKHSRLFLPFCHMFDVGDFGWRTLIKNLDFVGNKSIRNNLQWKVNPKRIFYVNSSPHGYSNWENQIHSARAMRIDQTSGGHLGDIFLPISTTKEFCPNSLPFDQSRPNLLYSCGAEHSFSKRYKGMRIHMPNIFNALNRSHIDMKLERTKEDYDSGFLNSKFCFITPGDTAATSQSSKAMCSGCVPIFILSDFRELPFSNVLDYNTFSIAIQSFDVYEIGFAENFYNDIINMVNNGTYAELRSNLEIARDFFNYHRFGSRSPYGAALISMYQDEKVEFRSLS